MPYDSSDFTYSASQYSSNNKPLLFLICFALFALLFNLGGRPIELKDYLKYAEIAREIFEFDDWVVMHLQGKIYVDKPPLHFWLIAGSYKLFGINPFAARLPSAIAGLCGVLLTFFFVKRLFGGNKTAFISAIMLLSAYDYLWWARRTRVDMVFAVLFSASIVFFYCGCESTSSKRKSIWYLAFWLATGWAFMDKAFIAFANLVVIIPYSVMVVLKPEGRKVSPGLLAVTSPCVLLPVIPWFAALVNHPDFSEFWEILGYTKIMARQEAFYFYLYKMPIKLFPATPFLILGIWGYARYRKQLAHYRELSFALLWIASYLFILHLTVAKNSRYLLPLYLPCSLVSAWAIQYFYHKNTEVIGIVINWWDRVFLVAASLSLASPLVVAYYFEVSLLPAFLYTAFIGIALLVARKFLPFKIAGLFVSFIILLMVIEVGDTVSRDKASEYNRMSHILKKETHATEQIVFYKCFSNAQAAMGFHFNQLINCSDSWAEISRDPNIRAIVTTHKAIEEESQLMNIENSNRLIPCGKRYVVVIKQN